MSLIRSQRVTLSLKLQTNSQRLQNSSQRATLGRNNKRMGPSRTLLSLTEDRIRKMILQVLQAHQTNKIPKKIIKMPKADSMTQTQAQKKKREDCSRHQC